MFESVKRCLRCGPLSGQPLTEGQWLWLGYLLLLPLYLLPLCMTRFLPGLDLPLHLSLIDAVLKSGQTISPQHELYQAQFTPSGYFAYYFLLAQLAKWMPIQLAHRIVMGGAIALLPLACARLLKSYGTSRLPSLMAFPLAYNMPLHYGFVSFACSIPILVLFLSQLILVLSREQSLRKDAPYLAGLGVLLYLSHIQTYGLALFLTLCLSLLPEFPWQRRIVAVCAVLPSVLLLGVWQSGGIFQSVERAPTKNLLYVMKEFWHARVHELHTPLQYLIDPLRRLLLFQVHLLRGFMDRSDQVMANVFLLSLGVYVGLGLLIQRRERQHVPGHRQTRLARWLPGLLAIGAYLGLPHHIPEFQTIFPRFAIVAAVLAFPFIPQALGRCPSSWLRGLTLLSLGPSCLYGMTLSMEYHRFDRELADFGAVLDAMPPGGKTLGLVYGDKSSRILSAGATLVNLPAYYPIERRSAQSLVPIVFCGAPGSPCKTKPGAKALPAVDQWRPEVFPIAESVSYFDYFLTHAAPPQPLLFGRFADRVELLATAGKWSVYRRKRYGAGPSFGYGRRGQRALEQPSLIDPQPGQGKPQ